MRTLTKKQEEEVACYNTNDFKTICEIIKKSKYSKFHVQAIVEVNARQFEVNLQDYVALHKDINADNWQVSLAINLYEDSVCEINIETGDRWDYQDINNILNC